MDALCREQCLPTPIFHPSYLIKDSMSTEALPVGHLITVHEQTTILFCCVATLGALHNVDVSAVGLDHFGKPFGYCRRQVFHRSCSLDVSRALGASMVEAVHSGDSACRSSHGRTEDLAREQHPSNRRLFVSPSDHTWSHFFPGPFFPYNRSVMHRRFFAGKSDFYRGKGPMERSGDCRLGALHVGMSVSFLFVRFRRTASQGSGWVDVAYACLPLYAPPGKDLPKTIDASTLGIPSEETFVEHYCLVRKSQPPNAHDWAFYKALALFRWASICQGVGARASQVTKIPTSVTKVASNTLLP